MLFLRFLVLISSFVPQATAQSTPAPPACRTSRIAGIPPQEAAPLEDCASPLTRHQRATRTPDVQRDLHDPLDLCCPQTDPSGTDRGKILPSNLELQISVATFTNRFPVFQEEAGLGGESPHLGKRHPY